MTVLQPSHDSRGLWPSTALLGYLTPKSGSKEGPVDPRTSILCSTPGVAVVGKFRSRIRILQFSTRKITPHGNVYISSARRPIVCFLLVIICFVCGTNLGIGLHDSACMRLTPVLRTLRRALIVRGLLCPLPYRILP